MKKKYKITNKGVFWIALIVSLTITLFEYNYTSIPTPDYIMTAEEFVNSIDKNNYRDLCYEGYYFQFEIEIDSIEYEGFIISEVNNSDFVISPDYGEDWFKYNEGDVVTIICKYRGNYKGDYTFSHTKVVNKLK